MIRPATPDDLPAIENLLRKSGSHGGMAPPLQGADLHRELFGEMPSVFLHVEEDGAAQIAGFAFWFLRDSIWRGRQRMYVADVYVEPSQQAAMYELELIGELSRIADEGGYGPLLSQGIGGYT